MKHLKLYENFSKKSYYEFDAIKFYNDFKEIFNKEKQLHPDFSGDFFKVLGDNLINNWEKDTPLDRIIEKFVKDILQDKEVEFIDLKGDIHAGRVENINFYYSIFFKKFNYAIDLYEDRRHPEVVNVDSTKPVKIYGAPTEIEKNVDLYLARNKYNI